MKKRINLKWLALLLPLLAGCASDEPDEVAKEVPFRVPVLSTQRSSASAANNTTIEVEGSQVGFFVRSDANYAGVENQSYSYRSGIGWVPNGTPIWLKSEQAEMVAYYPWSSIINTEYLELVPQLRDPDAPQDLWYKHFFASSIDGDLSLTLMQAYSRLVITFVTDETYPSDPLLYELGIQSSAFYETGYLNMWTGEYLDCSIPASDIITFFSVRDPADALVVKKTVTDTAAKFDCMLIPASLGDGRENVEFYITVGGEKYGIDTKQMRLDIPVTAFERELKAGNMYHLTIKISSRGLSFSTIDAQPWTNAPVDGDYGMS